MAAGFSKPMDVHDYFTMSSKVQIEEDEIKESLTEEEWFWLLG
jgi:hypothetical protein